MICPHCKVASLSLQRTGTRTATVVGGLAGGVAGYQGAINGASLGDHLDHHILKLYRCSACGAEFRADFV